MTVSRFTNKQSIDAIGVDTFFLHGARHKFDSIVSDTNRSGRECFSFDRRPNCRLQFTVALFAEFRLGKYKRRIDSAADYIFETPAKPSAFVCRPLVARWYNFFFFYEVSLQR